MKIFQKKDGGYVQLIGKEKMLEWPIELPLIFIEYVRTKLLDNYGELKKQVEEYLDEIMEDVAIPRMISVLNGDDKDEIISALTRIEEISKKNVEMAEPIKKYLGNLLKNNNKEIVKLAENISKNFESAERKKTAAQKRKIMREKEQLFLEGKISAEEYANSRKDYLTLKE
ncbi:MAG: hypothetical protein JW891_15255 [Candidatus Lokiarchaeota archaeon]|nr:hypothetical protein [Candidatus Lokiarchaeota archaeon]